MRIALAATLALAGCAADPVGWHQVQERDSLPAVIRTASLEEIGRRCPHTPGATGCAVSDAARGFCYVYVPADAPLWLLGHELLHCAGYNHEPYNEPPRIFTIR